jgi:hypothetical protein
MIDPTSPTWAEVKRIAEERLARAQDKIKGKGKCG